MIDQSPATITLFKSFKEKHAKWLFNYSMLQGKNTLFNLKSDFFRYSKHDTYKIYYSVGI